MEKREKMIRLMEKVATSGQTQKEFSASEGMAFPTFNYWFRKLKQRGEEQPSSGFVQVDTDDFSGGDGQLELVYPNGVKLRMGAADLSLLSRLIRLY